MEAIKAIRIHAHGGPDVLRWEDIEITPPGPDDVRIRHTAIGLNFSDVNVRRGGFYLNNAEQLPLILGNEAAGVVESIGANVAGFRAGDRVAYVGMGGAFYESTGAYATKRNVPAVRLIHLPDGISDKQAAAMLAKGLTASCAINRFFRPGPGSTVLIHAAASGVGLVLCQWSKSLGATVIGTVGSPEKARLAERHGCDHAIFYRDTDFVAAVNSMTKGGVDAVFDGVGKDTLIPSLDCTRPFGKVVNYGNASGPVPPLDLILLSKKGSLSVARFGLGHYITETASLRAACDELFGLVAAGILKFEVAETFALQDAANAHRRLESRDSLGAAILLP